MSVISTLLSVAWGFLAVVDYLNGDMNAAIPCAVLSFKAALDAISQGNA